MHEMYYGVYRMNEAGIMSPTQEDQLIAPPQYKILNGDYALIGNAWSVYYDDFSEIFKHQFNKNAADSAWIYPHSESLLTIADYRYKRKQYINGLNLSPVYLRDKVA
jgi:tRNA A37 threonylcarbamoyladenosine modification protein TsaB